MSYRNSLSPAETYRYRGPISSDSEAEPSFGAVPIHRQVSKLELPKTGDLIAPVLTTSPRFNASEESEAEALRLESEKPIPEPVYLGAKHFLCTPELTAFLKGSDPASLKIASESTIGFPKKTVYDSRTLENAQGMFLKEICIHGFKSFADKTRIALQPGITTIVGPNGCGKSNIVDAIRWVLGEQSAALRGGKLQDVIFEGSDKRKASSMCEVSLIFSNCEQALGTQFHEVAITRRVMREGSSNYYLNGKVCRLKDIQNLFMDTGIGRVSYSFMVQGQIDQILSSDPSQRRVIFEEAAGITRYKSQRKEALAKLDLVEQNLIRATDVMVELEKQTHSLKRQALKALRHQHLRHRSVYLELSTCAYKYAHHSTNLEALKASAADINQSLEADTAYIESVEHALKADKELRSHHYEALQSGQQAIFDLKTHQETNTNQIEFKSMRVQDVQDRIEQMRADTERLAQNIAEIDTKNQVSTISLQDQAEAVGSSTETVSTQSTQLATIQNALDTALSELSNYKARLHTIEIERESARAQVTQYEIESKTLHVKRSHCQESLAEAATQLEAIQSKLAEAQATKMEHMEVLEETQQIFKATEHTLEAQRIQFRDVQKTFNEQDRAISKITAQIQILTSLQTAFEGLSEGSKAILQGKLAAVIEPSDYKLLLDTVEIEPTYIPHFEALLAEHKDSLAVNSTLKLRTIAAGLREAVLGQAYLHIPLEHVASNKPHTDTYATLPDGITLLAHHVTIKDLHYKDHITAVLDGYLCIPSIEAFMTFWQHQPSLSFKKAATAQGDCIYPDGVLVVGNASDALNSGSFTQRKQQIQNLEHTLSEHTTALNTLQEESARLIEAIEQSTAQYESTRQDVGYLAEQISVTNSQLQAFEASLIRDSAIHKKLISELEILETQAETIDAAMTMAAEALKDLEASVLEQRQAIATRERTAEERSRERDTFRDTITEGRLELVEKQQKLQFLEKEQSNFRQQRQALQKTIQSNEHSIITFSEQVLTLESEIQELKIGLDACAAQLKERFHSLNEERIALATIEETITVHEHGLASKRKDHQYLVNEANKLHIGLAEERSRIQFLKEKVQLEYSLELEGLDWKHQMIQAQTPQVLCEQSKSLLAELADVDELHFETYFLEETPDIPIQWNVVEQELQQLRVRLQSIGSVNTASIQEYSEIQKRYEFLKAQIEDLNSAKIDLSQTIESINTLSRELFQTTFDTVRNNFEGTFQSLFGGGKANLNLTPETDILESGIEIIAQPPGTKLRHLTLLSGGQKTMTAVALLFAIYKVKPSPFCVLDELDAPLDEANIGRFTDILKQFTQFSQFLVISHNKRTISASDTVYGVTMQERGVTNLIAMKLQTH